MLSYLININSVISDVHTDYIADMICQLHNFHLRQKFIQQQHDLKSGHYVIVIIPLLR